ncbi:hypothetical protein KAR91_39670 [Candidatus Pacearchaeota archaeon]|nr:hypothetical protein [Candidatus Pacearchaeota archaeon]
MSAILYKKNDDGSYTEVKVRAQAVSHLLLVGTHVAQIPQENQEPEIQEDEFTAKYGNISLAQMRVIALEREIEGAEKLRTNKLKRAILDDDKNKGSDSQ